MEKLMRVGIIADAEALALVKRRATQAVKL